MSSLDDRPGDEVADWLLDDAKNAERSLRGLIEDEARVLKLAARKGRRAA